MTAIAVMHNKIVKGGEKEVINKRITPNNKHTLPFILISLTLILTLFMGTVSAADWTVGPGGSYNYTSIQQAIDNESTVSGDTISVYDDGGNPYVYNENVEVKKANLTIASTGQVTVNGSSKPNSAVFTVNNAGSLSSIIGFVLAGATSSSGVLINGADNVDLINLTINNCQRGVTIQGTSTNITADGIDINGTTGQGVYLVGKLTNVNINQANISNTGASSIEKHETTHLYGITINTTTITNPTGYGINLPDGYYYYGE